MKLNVALSNISIFYIWKDIRSLYNNKKFKISAATWKDKSELTDRSNFVVDIQDYFEYIL